jgi:uncharacterized membrane protein
VNINNVTSLALKCCLFIGLVLAAAGLVLSEYEYGDTIMWTGLLVVIASPFVGILATYAGLISVKDKKWVIIATILIIVIVIGLAISLLK